MSTKYRTVVKADFVEKILSFLFPFLWIDSCNYHTYKKIGLFWVNYVNKYNVEGMSKITSRIDLFNSKFWMLKSGRIQNYNI